MTSPAAGGGPVSGTDSGTDSGDPDDRPDSTGFGAAAWERARETRAAIDALPFLAGLADGSLDPAVLAHYLEQDALYLAGYARAMALLAARAPDTAAAQFWAGSAHDATAVEAVLHADLLDGATSESATSTGAASVSAASPGAGHGPRSGAVLSPTSLGYVSYLVATAATAPYAVGAAAVLPCYWVYADVGTTLLGRSAALRRRDPDHPCARWIAAQAAEGFQATARRAREVVDDAAAEHPGAVPAMHAAFATAVRYEHAFWDAAHRREQWPPTAGGPPTVWG